METPKSGFVYVLQMEGHDYYKIGRTSNLTNRVAQIKPQMPGRLVVVLAHRVPDAWKEEGRLHRLFERQRLNGEWFRLEADWLEEIKASLVLEQAVGLYKRLICYLWEAEHEVYFNPDRFARALYNASRRVERRHASYGRIYSKRNPPPVRKDAVLDAEFVG